MQAVAIFIPMKPASIEVNAPTRKATAVKGNVYEPSVESQGTSTTQQTRAPKKTMKIVR